MPPQGIKPGLGSTPKSLQYREEWRPQEFMRTYAEWTTDNRQQAIHSQSIELGGTQRIITVGKGTRLLVTSAFLSIHCTGTGVAQPATRYAKLYIQQGDRRILQMQWNADDYIPNANMTQTYTKPIVIEAGESVAIQTEQSGFCTITGGIQGWLESKKV